MSEPIVVLDLHRPFVVFGDHRGLSFDPIDQEDLIEIKAPDDERFRFMASCAWSSGCAFYFLALSNGIALLDLSGHGWLCTKRSVAFIELFLRSPRSKR
jgi:hypothetical protein